mmetsp:Transcript_19740/g.51396  ORF Transcript_19740/g.51396 Transcript_19740/m.51396 type:complete len:215 (+) Transcript_19740:506-1150(+)
MTFVTCARVRVEHASTALGFLTRPCVVGCPSSVMPHPLLPSCARANVARAQTPVLQRCRQLHRQSHRPLHPQFTPRPGPQQAQRNCLPVVQRQYRRRHQLACRLTTQRSCLRTRVSLQPAALISLHLRLQLPRQCQRQDRRTDPPKYPPQVLLKRQRKRPPHRQPGHLREYDLALGTSLEPRPRHPPRHPLRHPLCQRRLRTLRMHRAASMLLF